MVWALWTEHRTDPPNRTDNDPLVNEDWPNSEPVSTELTEMIPGEVLIPGGLPNETAFVLRGLYETLDTGRSAMGKLNELKWAEWLVEWKKKVR